MRVAGGLPINHGQGSVIIPLADVTGAQPPVFRKNSLVIVEVIALEVAASDRWSPNEDFTLRWVVGREVSGLGDIEELDFHGWRGETHSTTLYDIWWKDGAHGARLCHTVTYVPFVSSAQRLAGL